MKRWFVRYGLLIYPLLLAGLLLAAVLLTDNGLGDVDNQYSLMAVVLPLGLAVVFTGLSHGKAGRGSAGLGLLLALGAAANTARIVYRLGVDRNILLARELQYNCLYMGSVTLGETEIPGVILFMAPAVLLVVISALVGLFGKNRVPVSKVSFGKCILRCMPLLVTLAALGLGLATMITEQNRVRLEVRQIWAVLMALPMLLTLMLLWTSHRRGSKGAALWAGLCALVHGTAGVLLMMYMGGRSYRGEIINFLMIMSLAAALAELICALMALCMKRPDAAKRAAVAGQPNGVAYVIPGNQTTVASASALTCVTQLMAPRPAPQQPVQRPAPQQPVQRPVPQQPAQRPAPQRASAAAYVIPGSATTVVLSAGATGVPQQPNRAASAIPANAAAAPARAVQQAAQGVIQGAEQASRQVSEMQQEIERLRAQLAEKEAAAAQASAPVEEPVAEAPTAPAEETAAEEPVAPVGEPAEEPVPEEPAQETEAPEVAEQPAETVSMESLTEEQKERIEKLSQLLSQGVIDQETYASTLAAIARGE